MRKKYTDETYLRGVSKYNVTTKEIKEQNAYIVIKEIMEIIPHRQPFLLIDRIEEIKKGESVTIDNGFYIVEYTPINGLYNARAFLDNELNTISYYFDISLGNGVDNGRPYYDDLYLDIIYGADSDNKTTILDADELLEAFQNGKITKDEYDLANSVCSKLVKEIEDGKNIFINMDKKELIKELK